MITFLSLLIIFKKVNGVYIQGGGGGGGGHFC